MALGKWRNTWFEEAFSWSIRESLESWGASIQILQDWLQNSHQVTKALGVFRAHVLRFQRCKAFVYLMFAACAFSANTNDTLLGFFANASHQETVSCESLRLTRSFSLSETSYICLGFFQISAGIFEQFGGVHGSVVETTIILCWMEWCFLGTNSFRSTLMQMWNVQSEGSGGKPEKKHATLSVGDVIWGRYITYRYDMSMYVP